MHHADHCFLEASLCGVCPNVAACPGEAGVQEISSNPAPTMCRFSQAPILSTDGLLFLFSRVFVDGVS